MMRCLALAWAVLAVTAGGVLAVELEVDSDEVLVVPPLSEGPAKGGKRIKVTPPEYAGTEVYHTLYLPPQWMPDGPRLPIIFEYTGNFFPTSGSTGEVKDAALGFGLSGGRYIWVSLPYINADHTENEVTWWGDEAATVAYAKRNVPRIIEKYRADPGAVFLCGFSRGAIGVNYLGLHDDEVASLWTAFITHDHFDGVKAWGRTTWGSPLEAYRSRAADRLRRVGDRPYLVSQNAPGPANEDFIRSVLSETDNFTFQHTSTAEIFGEFPNEYVIHPHTDRWPLVPSEYRAKAWAWMNRAASGEQRTPRP